MKLAFIITSGLILSLSLVYWLKASPPTPSPLTTNHPIIDQPLPHTALTNPLSISGQARGTWFFEASFPLSLYDAHGQLLATGLATTTANWMTTDYIPFSAQLSFTPPAGHGTATLVLQKDNPSTNPNLDEAVSLTLTY